MRWCCLPPDATGKPTGTGSQDDADDPRDGTRALPGSSSYDATIVVHAPLHALSSETCSSEIAGGGLLHPDTVRKLACDSRLQVVLEGADGNALGIGLQSQKIPDWLRRQVFYRDGNTCTFPGCEMRRFLHPHHVVHWGRQGPTDLDNLVTVCTTHHTLVHEGRWSVSLDPGGTVTWFRPSGRIHDPGPAPPDVAPVMEKDPSKLAEAAGYSRIFAVTCPKSKLASAPASRARRALEEKRLAGL